jgi:hypothetical protein
LVVAATRSFNLGSKPGNHIVIKPDRNFRFPLGTDITGPRFAFEKLYSRFILLRRIARAREASLFRAGIVRMLSPCFNNH